MADNDQIDDDFVLTPVTEEDDFVLTPETNDDAFSLTAVAPPEGVLPKPTTDMYEDLAVPGVLGRFGSKIFPQMEEYTGPSVAEIREKAFERYRLYEQSPNVEKNWDGSLSWVDPQTGEKFVVPYPDTPILGGLFGGDMDPGLGQQIVSAGLYNLPRAVSEQFNIRTKDEEGVVEAQKMPRLAPGDSFIDQMATDATAPFLVGGGVGVGAVKLIANAPKIIKALTFAATETLVTKELMPSDAEPFLVGEEAAFPIFDGKEIDPSSPEWEQAYNRKQNLLKDIAVTTLGGEAAVKATGLLLKGTGIVLQVPLIKRFFSDSANERDLARTLTEQVFKLDEASPTYQQDVQNIIDLLEENKDVVENFNFEEGFEVDNIDFILDTATAYQRAVEAGDPRAAAEIAEELRTLSRGVSQKPGANLASEATARAEDQLDTLAQQTEEAFGNISGPAGARQTITETVEETGEEVTTEVPLNPGAAEFQERVAAVADEAVAEPRQAARAAQEAFDQAKDELDTLLQEGDLEFIGTVEEIYRRAGIDTTAARREGLETLVDNLVDASRVMSEEKDRLFGAVKGGAVDAESLISALDTVATSTNTFDNALAAVALDGQGATQNLLRATRRLDNIPETVKVGGKDVPAYLDAETNQLKPLSEAPEGSNATQSFRPETDEERLARVEKYLDDNNIDYGVLLRTMRTQVVEGLNLLTKETASMVEKSSAPILLRLKNFIDDDALDFVRQNDPDVASQAEEALEYYTKDFAPYWRDGGPLQEIDRVRRNIGGQQQEALQFRATVDQVEPLFSATRDRLFAQNVIRLLGREELQGSSAQIIDFIIGDVVSKLDIARTTGQRALSGDEYRTVVGSIKNELRPYMDALADGFPEVREQLMSFTSRLDGLTDDIDGLESVLKESNEAYEAAQEEIFNKTYKSLFPDGGPGVAGSAADTIADNPYMALQSLFRNPEGMPQIRALLNSGDDTIVQGVRSAYMRNLRDYLQTSAKTLRGQRSLSQSSVNNLLTTRDDLISNGIEIMGDDFPELMPAVNRLLELSDIAQGTRRAARGNFVGSQTNLNQEYTKFVDQMTTMILGPLNRTGARVRVLGRRFSQMLDENFIPRTLDAALANPEEFTRILRTMVNTDPATRKTVAGIPMPTAEERRLLYRFLAKSYIYRGSEEEFLEDYEAALQANLEEAQMQELGLQ